MNITGIMAAGPDGLIGKGNGLPWNYPDELDHFKQSTKGHVIVMGRKTFQTMPDQLFKDRNLIVFSRTSLLSNQNDHPVVRNLEEFFPLVKSYPLQKIFMIGGAEIAHLFLSAGLIKDFLLTKIHKSYSGDAYLELDFLNDWPEEIIKAAPDYTITHLKNPNWKYHED